MSKSEEFLNYYNEIDAFLKKDGNYVYYESYTQKVNKSKNKSVERYKEELIAFGELRNAIVHNPYFDGKPIAEPHEEIVAKIKEIHDLLTDPEKVFPNFKMKVIGAHKDDFINDILIEIKKRLISQFPVFDDEHRIIEVISTNTISHWLSKQLKEKGNVSANGVRVSAFLREIEHPHNYKFISKEASIYDAYDLFVSHLKQKKVNLDAIFITETGKGNERPLGMITLKDIASKIK